MQVTLWSEFLLFVSGVFFAQGISTILAYPAFSLGWLSGWFFMIGGGVAVLTLLQRRNTPVIGEVITEQKKLMDVREPYIDKIPNSLLSMRNRADVLVAKAVQRGLEPRKAFLAHRLLKIKTLDYLNTTHQKISSSDFPLDPILTELKQTDVKYQQYYRELKEAWFHLKHDKLLDVSLTAYIDAKDIQDSEVVVSRVIPLPNEEYKLQYDDILRASENNEGVEMAQQAISSSLERLRMGGKIKWKP
jgi:hypothetical protein